MNSGGGLVRGNAVTSSHGQGDSGRYTIAFDRDVSGCVATAALSDAQNGPTIETPPPGRVTVGRRRHARARPDVRRRRLAARSAVQRDRSLLEADTTGAGKSAV